MINPQWLKLPMSRTNFRGPEDVRAIEVQLIFKEIFLFYNETYNHCVENLKRFP